MGNTNTKQGEDNVNQGNTITQGRQEKRGEKKGDKAKKRITKATGEKNNGHTRKTRGN